MSNENMTHPVQVLHLKSETTLVSSGRGLFSRSALFFLCFIEKRNMFNSFTLSMFLQSPKGQRRSGKKGKATQTEIVNKDRQESCSVSRSVQTPDRRVRRHLAGAARIMRVPERNLRSDVGVRRGPCCTTDKQITRCNAHAI